MRETHLPLPPHSVIGIMGGGQLGRMLALEAARMGYRTHVFSPVAECPASFVTDSTTIAQYTDEHALQAFAQSVDVVTVEFENIPASTMAYLDMHAAALYPTPSLFTLCQHRVREKDFIRSCGIATAPYHIATNETALHQAAHDLGTPCIVKSTTMGYDGKGQYKLEHANDSGTAWSAINRDEVIVEGYVPFVCEASIIVARNQHGDITTFPVTQNTHQHGILIQSTAPAPDVPAQTQQQMQELATALAVKGELVGILAVECFIMANGDVMVNELAPRPHNSGHWTMDGCTVSQFEQLLRICIGLPMKQPCITSPTTMHNILGQQMETLDRWWGNDYATIHLYGKENILPDRKMAHVNVVDV